MWLVYMLHVQLSVVLPATRAAFVTVSKGQALYIEWRSWYIMYGYGRETQRHEQRRACSHFRHNNILPIRTAFH